MTPELAHFLAAHWHVVSSTAIAGFAALLAAAVYVMALMVEG